MINKFEEFNKMKTDLLKKIEERENEILKIIDDYVAYDDIFRRKHKIDFFKSLSFNINPLTDDNFIWYKNDKFLYGSKRKIILSKDEINDFSKFMENPELYKKSKKYNLNL
jgi:hypothetical protein